MRFSLVVLLLVCYSVYLSNATPRGAQIRLTKRGMNYAASIGVRMMQQMLTNRRIPTQRGNVLGVQWSAENLIVRRIHIGQYNVQPLANTGVRVSFNAISINAGGRLNGHFKLGWVKIGEGTDINVDGKNIGFNLDFKFGARNGKPHLTATSCAANINIDVRFGGSRFSFAYNLISNLLKGFVNGILRNMICDVGKGLINQGSNQFFSKFPVQLDLKVAVINYALQNPIITNEYLDLLLRGEFLNPKNPVPGPQNPPSFNTISSSNKMGYVWISDFTLNSAGRVLHETGLLKALVNPLLQKVPADLKPLMNTKSFEAVIPELYKAYPDRPLEFQVLTNKPPTFQTTQGKGNVKIYVRITIVVDKINNTKETVFYMDLIVDASGRVFMKNVNSMLNVGGNIIDFTVEATVGASTIGEIKIPLDDPTIKKLIKGLVVDNANMVLNNGLPLPNILGLSLVNPQVSFVQSAIRVDTDISYTG